MVRLLWPEPLIDRNKLHKLRYFSHDFNIYSILCHIIGSSLKQLKFKVHCTIFCFALKNINAGE